MKPVVPSWRCRFSPLRYWAQVDRHAVQRALRGVFAQWGMPAMVRVDNGPPWGGSDLPTDLALWLVGVGIAVHHNRPRHCEENGKVERDHGVLAAWVEPATCPDRATLARRLAAFIVVQRERYPACGRQPRATAFPSLAAGGQPYDRAHEAAQWDLTRVWAGLAAGVWVRRVDRKGQISLYNRAMGVGLAWAHQEVLVRFDPGFGAWQISDAHGTLLRTHPAPELRRGAIRTLAVSHRRPPRPHRHPAKPRVLHGGKPNVR